MARRPYNKLMAEEPQSQRSPEEEIQHLERQLEEKKRALAERGTSVPSEKELFREVLREHMEAVRPSPPSSPPAPVTHLPPVSPSDDAARRKQTFTDDKEKEEKVRALVEKAMMGTVEEAVKSAERDSPYMLDELHDRLVDDFYDKLIQLRKVKEF